MGQHDGGPGAGLALTITPTDTVAIANGLPLRLWQGVTPGGHPCEVWVALVGCGSAEGQAELGAELLDVSGPAADPERN